MTLELNLTALFVESIALMTFFIVYGATLVLDLKRYYEKRYSAQRLCIIKQVSVICVAMLFMLVQFVIEFLLCVDGFCNDFGTGKFPEVTVWLILGVAWIIVAEILAIGALIYSIWVAS